MYKICVGIVENDIIFSFLFLRLIISTSNITYDRSRCHQSVVAVVERGPGRGGTSRSERRYRRGKSKEGSATKREQRGRGDHGETLIYVNRARTTRRRDAEGASASIRGRRREW